VLSEAFISDWSDLGKDATS